MCVLPRKLAQSESPLQYVVGRACNLILWLLSHWKEKRMD